MSVGKTTLAINMAGWLDMYGWDIAVVDADWQRQSSNWLVDADPQIRTRLIHEYDGIVDEVPRLRDECHLVMVDTPPGLDQTAGTVSTVSDVVLIPGGTAPEIRALNMVSEAIAED